MYIFDSNSLIALSKFYPDRFPSLWVKVGDYVAQGRIRSVREVFREVTNTSEQDQFDTWVKNNKNIFKPPGPEETQFVVTIFSNIKFQEIVRKKQLLEGNPVADPFVIAAAKVNRACVVTEEVAKPNSAKIPNICSHFGIPVTNLQGFMEKEDWRF